MKKNIFYLISMSLIFIFITACGADDFNQFVGSDNIITITRDLSTFNEIVAQDDLDVNVVQSSSQMVEIVVNDNLQNQIKTTVANGILIVSLENGSYSNENFEVNIQMPNLERLQLDDNTRANVNFTSSQFEFEVDDSSTLTLEGASDVLNVIVNDDGKVNGFSFTTEILNASVSDDSDLEITCITELNGTVSDASEIRYRGMPVINAETSDNGKVINAN